jgi:hypothetical protein
VGANVTVINGSYGAQATGSVTVTELTLVPSCGNWSPTCAGGADPGVFQIAPRGTGAAGTNCAGLSFDIRVINTGTGRVAFTRVGGGSIVLAATDMSTELDQCRIDFTFSVLKVPAIDTYPGVAEPQTNQVAFMSVRHADGTVGADQGEDITTIATDTPVTTAPPTTTTTTTVKPPTTFTFAASPGSVQRGGTLTVSWTNLSSPSSNDWVGLYAVGAPGWSLTSWSFTGAAASGTVTLAVPAGAAAGSYELRLRTAKSNVVTVF